MKKSYIAPALALVFLAACSNSTPGTHTGESGPNMTNVENVNGNVPDTSKGAVLNSKPSSDSTQVKDSSR